MVNGRIRFSRTLALRNAQLCRPERLGASYAGSARSQIGTKQAVLRGWLCGRSVPKTELLFALLDALDVSGRWLGTGRGQMLGPRQIDGPFNPRAVDIDRVRETVLVVAQTAKGEDVQLSLSAFADVIAWLLEGDGPVTGRAVSRVLKLVGRACAQP